MRFIFNDGGRAAAGYKGFADDCVVRAIAIFTNKPYQEVYDAINVISKTERIGRRQKRSLSRNGVYKSTYSKYLKDLGAEWTATMKIGSGCQVHLREGELPSGRLLIRLSKHLTTVIDGVVYDTHDPSRNGTRCVYGYWRMMNG